jgi:hypothetical protein
VAFVTSLERSDRHTLRIQPSRVVCRYAVDHLASGSKLIQIDTQGSETRQLPGKVSQTLQFDAVRARQLWEVLGKEFGFRS